MILRPKGHSAGAEKLAMDRPQQEFQPTVYASISNLERELHQLGGQVSAEPAPKDRNAPQEQTLVIKGK
jgi:hypothetical protein